MLTAVRAMAHRVARDLAHMDSRRLEPGAPPAVQDELLAEVLERALEAGKAAVERGPELLPVLREAGVVDAGAYGLTVVLAGVIAALRGGEQPALERPPAPSRSLHLPQHESSRFRFCANFAVEGTGLEPRSFVPRLEELGDSVLVVGDERTLRVHVHTDDPDRAVAVFSGAGEVSRFDVADMRQQVADRAARLAASTGPRSRCGAVAVATGAGLERLYRQLGVVVVDGGPSMNPSTYELLAGIHAVEAEEVLVLPNSPNVVLAAERACELSERPARVVPTRAPQVGLSILVGLDGQRSAADNAAVLVGEEGRVRAGGVARAARDDSLGRFRAGDALGYLGEELVACGDPHATLAAVVERLAEGAELVTCIRGRDAPGVEGGLESALPEGVELEVHEGGQPAWWWLLSAE